MSKTKEDQLSELLDKAGFENHDSQDKIFDIEDVKKSTQYGWNKALSQLRNELANKMITVERVSRNSEVVVTWKDIENTIDKLKA